MAHTLDHNDGVISFWNGKRRDATNLTGARRRAFHRGFDAAQARHDDELAGLDTENTK